MASRTRKNIGVVGLGIIGQRVVNNLRERGYHVFVWNRQPRPVPNFDGSPAEVAELCDYIQIFVSDDDALLQMMQRMMPNLTAHHIVMAHCTVSPDTMRAAAEMAERRGAHLLDCPFTGSKNAAEKGELVYYVGGDEAALSRARPILEASSKEIIEIGRVGDATTVKVATNMVTAASVQAAAEALALISRSGLSAEKFAAAMKNNGSNSATLDMKLPMMMEGNFEPHFSVKHMLKDVVIATRLARGFAMEFGATDASRHGLVEEMRQGRGDDDYSSLLRQFLPAGRSLVEPGTSNGEEVQPSLAGIDEGKAPEEIPEVAGAVTAPAEPATSVAAPAETNVAPGVESVPAQATTIVESLPAHLETAQTVPAPVTNETPFAVQSSSEPKPADAPAVPAESTEQKNETEAQGLWGGFWRRRTDD